MVFKNRSNFAHSDKDKVGVLLVNLGTPSAPTSKALRAYLREFLSDTRVVEIPKIIWNIILYLIILPFRAPKSAKAYREVWTPSGSPLLLHTIEQCDAVRQRLTERFGDDVVVEYAMRYNQPKITDQITKLQDAGATKLIVLPLYPQYAASTTASVFDAVAKDLMTRRWIPNFRFITHYHKDAGYINAMAERIRDHWKNVGKSHLLLSFHGTPQRSLELGDPYFCECHATARLLTQALELQKDEYTVSFQSRFGKAQWLQPYTDATLTAMPDKGIKAVDVFCPGFSSDCLETLEEICVENREYFMNAGGSSYHYIEALNSSTPHIEALSDLLAKEINNFSIDDSDERMQHFQRFNK